MVPSSTTSSSTTSKTTTTLPSHYQEAPEQQRRRRRRRRRFRSFMGLLVAVSSSSSCRFTRAFLPRPIIGSVCGARRKRFMVTSISSLSLAADSRQLRFYHPVQEQLPNSSSTNTATATTTTKTTTAAAASRSSSSSHSVGQDTKRYEIPLTTEEEELFALLREVTKATGLETTLRVAGGWVRDKLLATTEFQRHNSRTQGERLTSKIKKPTQPSMGRQGTKVLIQDTNQPVDIDIALDDMLGREFADHLNEYLSKQGQETVSVGVVLKNPEKSKHLETATMKVGAFWIDFVNLRAEEYTQDSRIPDLMRIGTPLEDAMRRDLTINALFYNINQQIVEDFTGRGCDDLRRGIVSTPLAPLTTLLDDPLRVLRSVRFAARLRFNIEDSLVDAAKDEQVRTALAQKVSRERVGGEVDLMLRSPDAVGAMNLLINLNLAPTVFPIERVLPEEYPGSLYLYTNGLHLLSTAHDHLCECKMNTPLWCKASHSSMTTHGYKEATLLTDEEARRLLWYAAFLKPLMDYASLLDETKPRPGRGKKSNRSVVTKLLVDELKRPARDAESVDKIIAAADDFSMLINHGCDWTAQEILLNDIQVTQSSIKEDFQKAEEKEGDVVARKDELGCAMKGNSVCSETEQDPLWQSAMQFRLLTSKVLQRVGHLWRAALMLSLSEQLVSLEDSTTYAIEGDVVHDRLEEQRLGIIERYDTFAAAMQSLGLIGVWSRKPLLDGGEMKKILPKIPFGPAFREVMDEQVNWMTAHPSGGKEGLANHLRTMFPEFVE